MSSSLYLAVPLSPMVLVPYSFRVAFVVTLMLSLPFAFNYAVAWIIYHMAHRRKTKQIPPSLPSFLPFLGSTIPFLFDSVNFAKRATTYAGRLTNTCITLGFDNIYLIQESSSIAAMWKESLLSSPIYIYAYALQNVFGMPSSCLDAYRTDNSGPYKKAHPDSKVADHNRVDHLTHESLARAFSGPGLKPTYERFQKSVERKMKEISQMSGKGEWKESPDMLTLFRNVVGSAIIESIFGRRILELNPTFMDDLWDFDDRVPLLAKRVPQFLLPKAYRTRRRLLNAIKKWHNTARNEYRPEMNYPDGDGDPVWGSYLMRERQQYLRAVDGQNDDGIASADLGLIWTSVTNLIPSVMMASVHICNDSDLLSRVQHELRTKASISVTNPLSALDIDTKALHKLPLLNSIYAETLRCHVQAYITRCSAQSDVSLGAWWLPKSDVAMVSSYVSHMDENVWNTKNGERPVRDFWADRFLVDVNDPDSGPIQRQYREQKKLDEKKRRGEIRVGETAEAEKNEVFCDMRGLEGHWIPYGGGYGACPGRILTKQIMLWFCAYMITYYEVDVLTREWEMDNSGFGFGTQKPKEKIAFRIRERQV